MRRRLLPKLRPSPGRRVAADLKPRPVSRRAEQLPRGVHDPALRTLLQRIDQAPILGGHDVTVYFAGAEAFAAMCQAIDAAQREVLLQSYILKDDAIGERLAETLAAAAARGVTVRVLADAFGSSRTRGSYWRRLRRAGIKARLINNLMPALWYGKTYRDHRKLLIVDRQVAFTGGMNLALEYVGSPEHVAWRDTHARIVGPAAWEMAVVFAEGWGWALGRPFPIEPLVTDPTAAGSDVLVLDSRPWRGHLETASALAASAGAARTTLWITNAYFAPQRVTIELLSRAARRGVDVRLLLAGLTDVPLVRHAGHGFFDELLVAGVRIFEYQPRVLHAKTLVIDRHLVMVGSTNIDFRSFHFNAECNALIFDGAVGAALANQFERDLVDALEIDLKAWRGRPRWHRWGDWAARQLAWAL